MEVGPGPHRRLGDSTPKPIWWWLIWPSWRIGWHLIGDTSGTPTWVKSSLDWPEGLITAPGTRKGHEMA